jgi:hypothetical protein
MLVAVACAIACAACKQPEAKLTLGTVPATPFGAFGNLAPGATLADVKRELPQATFDLDHEIATEREGDATYTIAFVDGRVDRMAIAIAKHSADELWQAWGSPGDVDAAGTHQFWDRPHGMRADVSSIEPDAFTVAFVHYVPLAKLLEGNDVGAIDHVQILGRPLADVVHDLGAHHYPVRRDDDQHASILFPRDDWSASGIELSLTVSAGPNVDQYALSDVASPKLDAILTTRYGEPTKADDGGVDYYQHPRVHLADGHVLTVTDDSRLAGSGAGSAR